MHDDRDFLREIETKDVQIAALLERDREINILFGSLQKMLAPLLRSPRAEPRATMVRRHFGVALDRSAFLVRKEGH